MFIYIYIWIYASNTYPLPNVFKKSRFYASTRFRSPRIRFRFYVTFKSNSISHAMSKCIYLYLIQNLINKQWFKSYIWKYFQKEQIKINYVKMISKQQNDIYIYIHNYYNLFYKNFKPKIFSIILNINIYIFKDIYIYKYSFNFLI